MSNLDQLISLAEQTEAAVIADVTAAAPADVAARLGLVLLVDSGAAAGFFSTIDSLTLNRVVGLGACAPASEAQLDRILELGRASGVRRLFFQLAPTADLESLIRWLEARTAPGKEASWWPPVPYMWQGKPLGWAWLPPTAVIEAAEPRVP